MNPILHFLFNYIFIEIVFGNAWQNLAVILVFSLLIDVTHLPYLIKVKRGVIRKRFGSQGRTRFHEIYGLSVFSAVLSVSYFLYDPVVVKIAVLCLVLHFSLDFVSGKSMPFYPYSKREVFMKMAPYGYREKIIFEAVLTLFLGVIFWLMAGNLIL